MTFSPGHDPLRHKFTAEQQAKSRDSLRARLVAVFSWDWKLLTRGQKKKRLALEQEGRCLHCGLYEWRGSPIVLEVDHVDGDHGNEQRDNLRLLCPNCHSQTPTWKVKKSALSKRRPTRDK